MLMILLFQRLGIIMILAFLLVNNSYFRQLIEEVLSVKSWFLLSFLVFSSSFPI